MSSLVAAAALALPLNGLVAGYFRAPFPDPSSMKLAPSDAVQSSSLLAFGMRRLAADLSFIQMMMYYGSPEAGPVSQEHKAPRDERMEYGRGGYPELKDRALRVMDLDPFFAYSTLYAAGALAFNIGRPDDALTVLAKAARYDPRRWQYRIYTAAIGFSKRGSPGKALWELSPALLEEVLRELSPALLEPDCPVMLKSMLAFSNVGLGRREEAIRIYKDILQSRDGSYNHIARAMLHELRAEGW